MGRPWWYDSYWEKRGRRKRGFRPPGGGLWVWAILAGLSLLLTLIRPEYRVTGQALVFGFASNVCRLLSFAILVRVLLSWFEVSPYSPAIVLLDRLTEPLLRPLRRAIPLVGMFDITPIVAILILQLVPVVLRWVLW